MVTGGTVHRPVFLLGPPRSGTSLLAWGLGQHSRFRVVAEGGGIARLARELEATVQRAGLARPAFPPDAEPQCQDSPLLRRGGVVLEAMPSTRRPPGVCPAAGSTPPATPLEEPPRWVCAHPDNALHVQELLSLCPTARFVFLLRDVDAVVDALVERAVPDGSYYTGESARELWLRTVQACLEAERAFGSDLVHRVHFAELAESPEPVLRRCLEFLDEPFEAACLRPCRLAAAARRPPPRSTSEPASRSEAERVSRELLREPPRRLAPDPELQARMARRFRERAARAAAADTTRSPVQQLREVVRCAAPPGTTVVVVSRGDDALLELGDRTGWHFPRTESGQYAGWYPADGAAAIRHLEELRARGGEFLVFPCTAFWWLAHYPELRRHLERRYRIVAFHEDSCIVFSLRRPASGPPLGVSLVDARRPGVEVR